MSSSINAVKCKDCGIVHPVGIACCPGCGSENLEPYSANPKGIVYTFSVNTFVPAGKHKARAPYVIGVIETEEKMRITAIVETPEPGKIKIGDKVVFKEYEDSITPIFTLAT